MNVPYHLARLEGKITRSIYRAALPKIVRKRITPKREMPFDVFAYSGENTLPEQVASIRSFLIHAGRPNQFTVVSDGSHTHESVELLEKIDNCVRVRIQPLPLPAGLPEKVQTFLKHHFTGKQLALIMSLPENGPALYTDSDVLFFPRAHELATLAEEKAVPALYLADHQFSADERLVQDAIERGNPVNMGFLLLFRKLDWAIALERLRMFSGVPSFFTTQTATHLCLHANGAVAFDPAKFVLKADDEFIYRDRHGGSAIAMRHYVNPIRHKFWTPFARRF